MSAEPALAIEDLRIEFKIGGAWRAAVRGLSLDLRKGETLAVVGESGSGKSVTALSVLRLLPDVGARVASGRIRHDGRDLLTLNERAMAAVRGARIAMIFQEPMTTLNPTMRVGEQIAEALLLHRPISRREARDEALRLMREVKIPAAETRIADYPHRFSGGMRQRVMIAMALACRPEILLADEPTTALDVTIQAQVLALVADLKKAYGMSILFITHNLGVVAAIADRVAVMYAGQVVEIAPARDLFADPRHPYTRALIAASPRVDRDSELTAIPGSVPSLAAFPPGCAFAARCPRKIAACETSAPDLLAIAPERAVRCPVTATVRT